MERAVRLLAVLSIVSAVVCAPLGATAAGGTTKGPLTVRPGVLQPGQTATVCGGGFSFHSDRVASTAVDGLAGPHGTVGSDGRACIRLAYADFQAPADRDVPLVMRAQGPTGLHVDTGHLFLAGNPLAFTGGAPSPRLLAGALLAVLGGCVLLASGTGGIRRRGPSSRGT